VISFEDYCKQTPFFTSRLGRVVARFLYRATKMDEVYRFYLEVKSTSKTGVDYIDEAFLRQGVKIEVANPDAMCYFTENKLFVTVSNHPYGMYDGMSLVRTIATVRPDIRGITNFLLSKLEPIACFFIPVNPFTKGTSDRSSLPGLREAMHHIGEGHPLFFFPAGQVSPIVRWFRVADRTWQLPTVKLIQKTQVPVIPVYFEGHNSWKFLLSGLIHPMLRTMLIPSEMLNKRGKTMRLHIGKPISVEEQKRYKTPQEFGRFLYRETYKLKGKI
jgi:putative hemolysin